MDPKADIGTVSRTSSELDYSKFRFPDEILGVLEEHRCGQEDRGPFNKVSCVDYVSSAVLLV